MTTENENVEIASMRFVNESAIREHALKCSALYRAGRFSRVGEDFIDEVKADVENLVRQLRNSIPVTLNAPLEPSDKCFVTGVLSDKVMLEWNRVIGRIIQNKVQRQPSVGKTLGRTR